MIRVLIADDEKRIRDGLAATIPWDDLGMRVVATAAHGEAALALARETRPQIILTDVRMPRMDGLAFLRHVRAFLPRVKVVILSGYDDFAYAQQAVKLGVSDYLVKPVGSDEIIRTLEGLRAGLDEEGEPAPRTGGPADGRAALGEALLQGDEAGALAALGLWRTGQEPEPGDVRTARTRAVALVDELVQELRREGFEFRNEDSPASAEAVSAVLGLDRATAVEAWLDGQVAALADFARRNRRNNHTLLVRRALEFIETHYAGQMTIEGVAREVGLSPNYFSHLFKKVRGQGFKDHVNLLRVSKARELLAAGGLKVYEVALRVGFSDYKYFSAVFKKVTGTAPTRYSRTASG